MVLNCCRPRGTWVVHNPTDCLCNRSARADRFMANTDQRLRLKSTTKPTRPTPSTRPTKNRRQKDLAVRKPKVKRCAQLFCTTLSQMHNKPTCHFEFFPFICRKNSCAPFFCWRPQSVCASVVVAVSSGMSRAITTWRQQADWPLALTAVCANHKKKRR